MWIEKARDGRITPILDVDVREIACGLNHSVCFCITISISFSLFQMIGPSVNYFLAQRIRKSESLAWIRNSNLSHVILPRLSQEDCSLVVLELTHMVVK